MLRWCLRVRPSKCNTFFPRKWCIILFLPPQFWEWCCAATFRTYIRLRPLNLADGLPTKHYFLGQLCISNGVSLASVVGPHETTASTSIITSCAPEWQPHLRRGIKSPAPLSWRVRWYDIDHQQVANMMGTPSRCSRSCSTGTRHRGAALEGCCLEALIHGRRPSTRSPLKGGRRSTGAGR